MNYEYHIVEGDGPVKTAIEDFMAKQKAFADHANAVVKYFNAKGIYVSNSQIAALTFENAAPDGWLKVKKTCDGYRPPAKEKESCKFMYAVSGPSSFSLPASQVLAEGCRIYFPKFESIGDILVWITPEGSKFDHTGCRSIKTSEYYAIKGD